MARARLPLLSVLALSGIAAGGLLIWPGEPRADGYTAGLDSSRLVRFGERAYDITHEDWVSTHALTQATVRKISYGKTSLVRISTTASGTYSREGLFSPHIRYPGIHVEAKARPRAMVHALAFWSEDAGWVAQQTRPANSLLRLD